MTVLKSLKTSRASKPSDRKTYGRLLGYVRHYWYVFVIAAISTVLYSAVDAALVRLVKPLIDEGFVARDPAVIRLIPLFPLVFVARGLMSFCSNYSMTWLSRKIVSKMRSALFAHLLKLPATFYDTHTSAELLSAIIFNVEQIAKACTDAVIDSVRNGFLVIFLVGIMLSIDWQLTAWFLLGGPFIYALFSIASRRLRKFSRAVQISMGHVTHVAEENLTGYKVVRIFGAEAYEAAQFSTQVERNRRLEMHLAITRALSEPVVQIVGGIALALTLYVAMQDTGPDALTAGGFASLITAMLALLKPIKELTSVNGKIQQGIAGAESIFALLDIPTEPETGSHIFPEIKGAVSFTDVSFCYPGQKVDALHQINFAIKPGQTVALVGHSGGGKSTLVSLLPRLYDDYQGKICIDGFDIRDIALKNLRQQFAIVSQQVSLFNDTVAHNIAYGCDVIDEVRLREAAIAAQALEFIEKLPQGFATAVGEDGVLLSGGQRQRIAIARALYKNAPILILDEATSALDSIAEAQLQIALTHLMQNRTTFVIAHRLSTIEGASQIIVMDEGQIKEMGTHGELLAQQGYYSRLYQSQFQRDEFK